MDILLIGGIILAIILYGGVRPVVNGMNIEDTVKDALLKGIVGPLALKADAGNALYVHTHLETGGFAAHYFLGMGSRGEPPTYSLFNRHRGEGVLGVPNSDGEWTGQVRYITAADPDLRVYTDVYQSARDMKQWLLEPSHRAALQALQLNSPGDYFQALQDIGFSTQADYASALQNRYGDVIG